MGPMVMRVESGYVGGEGEGSVLANELMRRGTALDLANAAKTLPVWNEQGGVWRGKFALPEYIACFYTLQLLRLFHTLHNTLGIVHGPSSLSPSLFSASFYV